MGTFLPDNVLIKIFKFLPPMDRLHCMETFDHWSNVIANVHHWPLSEEFMLHVSLCHNEEAFEETCAIAREPWRRFQVLNVGDDFNIEILLRITNPKYLRTGGLFYWFIYTFNIKNIQL